MSKFFVTLMASLLSVSAAFAFFPEGAESSFDMGVGYRNDCVSYRSDLNFLGSSSDGSSSSSGIDGLSTHTKWKNLRIWEISAKGKYVTCDDVYLRLCADYGWVTHGKRHVTLGAGSESVSITDLGNGNRKARGHVYDVNLGLGYQFRMCDDSFAVAPVVGYSWHGQHLHNRNGSGYSDYYSSYDSSSSSDDYFSSYSGSYGRDTDRYHTRWNGPFVGLDFDYKLGCEWSIFAAYEYHWAHFHARSRNFASTILGTIADNGFTQHAKNAHGQIVALGAKWDFCDCWTLGLTGKYNWFCAKRAKQRFIVADASFGDLEIVCAEQYHLKHVKWHSGSITVDLGYAF